MGKRSFVTLMVMFSMVLVAGVAWGTDFSADVVMDGPMGRIESKVYSRDGILRQESAGPMGRMATITWPDEDRRVVLMLEQRSYMEVEDPEEGMGPDLHDIGGDLSDLVDEPGVTRMGSEKIQGFVCEKLEVVDQEMPDARSTIWFSRKLGFPLKTVYESQEGSMLMECRNISLEKPDAVLFQVPQGFQRLDVPMGMPSELMEMLDQD